MSFYGIIRNHKTVTTNPVGRLFGALQLHSFLLLHSILLHLYHLDAAAVIVQNLKTVYAFVLSEFRSLIISLDITA
jgi:hypothetical protein